MVDRDDSPSSGPSDGQILGRSVAIGAAGILATGFVSWAQSSFEPRVSELQMMSVPEMPDIAPPVRTPIEITDGMRRKGIHECNPPDPLGLGPYTPYRNVAHGRLTIPQKGGRTAEGGHDVVVHFHGHEPLRKTLVQVARGVAYVGVDKGLGSGPYAEAFKTPGSFDAFRRSIESGLRAASGDDRAHVRHLALSAWSAGYGAINEILKHGDEGIDAVVLLDGLHAAWNRTTKRGPSAASASARTIKPVFEFARRALSGDRIFVFSHSRVDPVDYPSTRQTADLMLAELELERVAHPDEGPFSLSGSVDVRGFHLWSYRGRGQKAHCEHLRHFARVLTDVLEPAWNTPPMDRDVPATKAPRLGTPADTSDPGSIELAHVDPAATPPSEAPAAEQLDHGGFEPVPKAAPPAAP